MNDWIWTIGLLLQCLLIGVLVGRGVARILPLFTGLIGFYVARSLFLFTTFGHLSGATYSLSYQTLSLIDSVFQILVAWELFCGGRRNPVVPSLRKSAANAISPTLAAFCALLMGSATIAWAVSKAVSATLNSPLDRGVLLSCLLILAVAAFRFLKPCSLRGPTPRRILEGFAVFGAVDFGAQIGRTIAAQRRDSTLFSFWSHLSAFVYLAVLVFWIVVLLFRAVNNSATVILEKRKAPA